MTDLDGSRIRHDVTYADREFSPEGLTETGSAVRAGAGLSVWRRPPLLLFGLAAALGDGRKRWKPHW